MVGDNPPTKACTRCGEIKALTEFSRDAREKTGRRSACKVCAVNCHRIYEQSPEGRATRARANSSPKGRARGAWRRAINSGTLPPGANNALRRAILPFYEEAVRKSKETGEPYEVDHKEPYANGGLHTPDNLWVIPRWLNKLKNTMSWEAFTAIPDEEWERRRQQLLHGTAPNNF